jgi:alpha-tubulin suppressor-like RCC1 family protein
VLLYGTRRLRDGSLALIMQYVPGVTLRAELQARGALPVARVRRILTHLASALAHAHTQGIIHRDIKPENIYLDENGDVARLSDFGIARPLTSDSSLTLPGSAIGTPAYMSPEQIDGTSLDGRSDLYSLGLIGWEMLSGRQPWAGLSLYSMIYKQKHEALPSPALARGDVPPGMLLALEGALRKNPAERLSGIQAFQEVLNGRTTALPPASAPALADRDGGSAPASSASIDDGATIVFRRDQTAPPAEVRSLATTASAGAVTAARPGASVTPEPASDAPFEPLERTFELESGDEAPQPGFFGRLTRRVVRVAVVLLLLGGAASAVALTLESQRGDEAAVAESEPPQPPSIVPPAGVPTAAIAVSGTVQEGLVGDTLPQWLVLRVQDEAGRPLEGVEVSFAVVGGVSELTQSLVRTDEMGLAGTRWLPAEPGTHAVSALVRGREDLGAEFTAEVLPRPAARIAAASGTSVGQQREAPVSVRLEDDRGNPVSGAQVNFTVAGGGTVSPAQATTDTAGVARAQWTVGSTGAQEVRASVAGASSLSVRFTAAAPGLSLRVRPGLAAGGTHSCWLDRDGSAACWGGNDSGQLGDGSATRGARPVTVRAPEPLSGISAGVSHTCAVSVSGEAYCWGANASGQLGSGGRTTSTTPIRVATGSLLTAVAAGAAHTCGIDQAGRIFCWGGNQNGQLGDGTRTARPRPAPISSRLRFRSVTAGWAHTCGLATDGRAWCWGRNGSGELGTGRTADSAEPAPVAGGHRFTALAAGSTHTCGLRTDGTVLCWGDNSSGQLGREGPSSAAPVAVASDEAFSAIEAGGVHSCALTRAGSAFCWGRNVYGQLGNGSTADTAVPVPVAGGLRFATLHASGAHTCGSTTEGAAYCWGFNMEGQLGDRSRTNQSRPVPINRW